MEKTSRRIKSTEVMLNASYVPKIFPAGENSFGLLLSVSSHVSHILFLIQQFKSVI